MFFYEWVIPAIAILILAAWAFYVSVKNRTGAGIRTDGRTLFDKSEGDHQHPDS